MRKQIVKMSVMAVAAIALGGAAAAHADETLANVKVPFAFFVNDVRLPAGDYIVRQASEGGQVLEIVSKDGRHVVFTPTIPFTELTQSNNAQLVFEKFGDAYFLSRVAPADGNDREIVLTPASMEHEIIKSGEHAAN
ncbi:MAG TPA: hypothetical protein VH417_19210 [Vicinamibacterales bacterium]|jgi:hypothetical protein